MEALNDWITCINDIVWSYFLIFVLIGCALWFTIKGRFVQFRMLGEMFRLLRDSAGTRADGTKQISSFQAFMVSLASRIGTGNLAGVASAIAVGGPGAVFWMWLIALFGSASAFVESTLAQLYKEQGKDSYIGGPAYYMKKGLKKPWMGILFACLITLTFGLAFNTVQSNTICEAWEQAFGIDHVLMGVILTVLTLFIIFGGIKRIADFSSIVVPVMAVGYLILAIIVIAMNITEIPAVIYYIVANAFGVEQFAGGTLGATMMQGIKRGLFSNEAGEGSAPNVAATADVTHPVKQGLIQALGVFTDTIVVCSCTAFIILCSGAPLDGSVEGIKLTQIAMSNEIGSIGYTFVAVAILLFAYSSVIGNYYYGEANVRFITPNKGALFVFRLSVGAMVMLGALMSLKMVWNFADITMAAMTLCNLIAIAMLNKQAFLLLKDYVSQKKAGIKSPVYTKDRIPELEDCAECW